MLFTHDAVDGLRDGSITVTFRSWTKPRAKIGGRYRTWGLLLEVDDLTRVHLDSITDADARRSGAESAAAVRARLSDAVDAADGKVWRVEFRCLGADDRLELRQVEVTPTLTAELQRRLDRMDRSSRGGPWTRHTLRLISSYPGVVSTVLARHVDQERPTFKLNVRKLKELGLTESLEVGYRLSPLGISLLEVLDQPPV